jgi:translation initiation factor IF-2
MTKQTIVMINGRPYDAATGMLVDQSAANVEAPSTTPQPQPLARSPRAETSRAAARPLQRSTPVSTVRQQRPTAIASHPTAKTVAQPAGVSAVPQPTPSASSTQKPVARRHAAVAAPLQPAQISGARSRRSIAKPAFLSPSAPSKPQAVATLGHIGQLATKKQPATPAQRATTSRQQQIDHQAPAARQAIATHQPTAPQPKAIRHTPVAQTSTAVAKPTVQQNISRPLPKPKRLKTLPHYAVTGSTMPPKQAFRSHTVQSPKPVATYAPAQQPKQSAAQPQRSAAPTSLEAELLAATEEYMRRARQSEQTNQAAVAPAAPQQEPASLAPPAQQTSPQPAATPERQSRRTALSKHLATKSRKTEKPARRQQSAASKFIRFSGLAIAGVAVLLLGIYMLYTTIPGISTQVAAAQTGVAASYPTYRPEGYDLTGPITAKDGKVAMTFGQTGGSTGSYTIMQEKTDQESDALSGTIKKETGHDPAITRIDGLTIYTYDNGNAAAWVNKNILYTIKSDTPLTSTQVQQIATSM